MGYFKSALKGISWMGALRGSTRLMAFVKIAILARILTPEQFGLFGIALLVLAFLEIVTETGINVFFVQEEGKLKDYLNTAWVVSIARGVLMSMVLLALSPLIASFFKSPELASILYLMALVPFLRGFINPSIVRFQKELQFNKEFALRVPVYLIDAIVAVLLGYITKSAASLVYGLAAGVLLEIALSFYFIKPRPRFKFEFQKVKRVIDRGKWLTAAGFFNYLFTQGDDIVVGKMLDTNALGLYQVPYRISTLPIQEVGEVLNKVTFPVYTKIQGDRKRLFKAFMKILLGTASLVIPFGLLLIFFPKQIILIVLGTQWLETAAVLQTLAVFGVIRSLTGSAYPVYLSVKKQEYATGVTLLSIFGMGITIIPLVNRLGILGAAYSALIGAIVSIPLVVYYLVKIFRK